MTTAADKFDDTLSPTDLQQYVYLASNVSELLETAKASLTTALSILQSEIERRSCARGARPGAFAAWQIGPFELSSRARVLRRDGVILPLGGRAFDILIYLAERPGEVIAKQELLDRVWSDVTVQEGSIRVHVSAIRKALGDDRFGNHYIANIKGRGYSFVGTVVPLAGSAESRNHRRHEGAGS